MKDKAEIFVFGSNLAGRHGKGAAHIAYREHGAAYNVGVGPWGKSYAIPTKDWNLAPLPLGVIQVYVYQFLNYADMSQHSSENIFRVTRVGCGYTGYQDHEMAAVFLLRDIPKNCAFDTKWKQFLGKKAKYWGTYDG